MLTNPHGSAPLACAYGNPLCPNPSARIGEGHHAPCLDVESLNGPRRYTLQERTIIARERRHDVRQFRITLTFPNP
jgi:hypothetical protein